MNNRLLPKTGQWADSLDLSSPPPAVELPGRVPERNVMTG